MRSLTILALFTLAACGPPPSDASEPRPADDPAQKPSAGDDEASTSPSTPKSPSPSDADEAPVDSTANPDHSQDVPALKPDPSKVELELSMDRHVGTGYGCGGHCASNTQGSSSVVLLCMKDQTAMMMDAGETTHTMSYPDGSSSETTAWSYAWKGTCLREGPALVFELKRTTAMCNRTSVTGDQESTAPCVNSTKKVLIGCKLEDVQVVDEIGVAGAADGGKKELAWTCNPDPKNKDLGGTPAPWVFGDTTCIGTWYVGEPTPQTHIKHCP